MGRRRRKADRPPPAAVSVPPRPSWLRTCGATLLVGAAIVTAVVAVYSQSLRGEFVYDDQDAIANNPSIRRLWPLWPVLSPPAVGGTVSGRPVLNLSLALNYALGETDVWGYHAVNLGIHAAAALVLFGIVRRTLIGKVDGGPKRGGQIPNPNLEISNKFESRNPKASARATWLAAAVAVLWAVHPLQTEAVAYIVQRAEVARLALLPADAVLRDPRGGTASRFQDRWDSWDQWDL